MKVCPRCGGVLYLAPYEEVGCIACGWAGPTREPDEVERMLPGKRRRPDAAGQPRRKNKVRP